MLQFKHDFEDDEHLIRFARHQSLLKAMLSGRKRAN